MRRSEAGYTLIGLMVVIALVNIGLGVAMTSWATIGKRAREAELIWRGQQYVRALQCHRQQTGALPGELDELLESDCIRALYPEPMSGSGEWRLVRESDVRGVGTGSGLAAEANDILDSIGFGDPLQGARGGQLGPAQGTDNPRTDSLQAAYQRLSGLRQRLSQSFDSSGNGIVGVVSTSTDEALRTFRGEQTYDAWRFLVQ